jgi:hypothetical protein
MNPCVIIFTSDDIYFVLRHAPVQIVLFEKLLLKIAEIKRKKNSGQNIIQ